MNRFRVPLPSVSESPMLVKRSAMIGFFGKGLNLSGVSWPMNRGLLASSVRIPSVSMTSLAGNGLVYSRWMSVFTISSRQMTSLRLTTCVPSRAKTRT